MNAHANAVAEVREARRARDAARDRLYALELRRVELERALKRDARGHGAEDPAVARALRALEAEAASLTTRLDDFARRLAELAALPARISGLRQRVTEEEARAAQRAQEAGALAQLLSAGPTPVNAVHVTPKQREAAVARLREVQARRAEAESAAQPLREELAALEARAGGREEAELRHGAAAVRSRLSAVDTELSELRNHRPELGGTAERNRGEISAQRAELEGLEARVREAIGVLYAQRTPQELIEAWDDGLPILLLPLRLETRWKTADAAAPELWVRVYPDDVAVTTHEQVLTDAEVTHGRAYWTQRRAAASDEERTAAWRTLAERFSANRAAWVASQTRPVNWDAALADAALPLEFPAPPLTKPDAWTTAPHSRVLPDRFVLLGWRGGELKLTAVGAPVDDVVVLGPSPLEDHDDGPSITRDQVDRTLKLGASFGWVRDFDDAVRRGMGFRLRVDAATVHSGFDQLLVLGLKLSADDQDAKTLVEELLANHHYSRPGFALVSQGTPTNNTGGNDSGFTRAGRNGDESVAAEAGPALFEPAQDRARARDGQRLADFLGLAYEPLLHVEGAGLAEHAEAVAMNRALYAGTAGYYLDHMLNEVVDEDALGALRRHFTDHVTGRGPLATIRVGSQPYGILPTSAFARWRPQLQDLAENPDLPRDERFGGMLHHVLSRFDQAWSAVVPRLAKVGAAGEGAANLLDVLGLHPTSEELYQRVGYSYDTLRNMEALVWGGHEFRDVLNMLIEGATAHTLLGQLGYRPQHGDGSPKPFPLLLQLIWRRSHTRLESSQLIDGQPLSETALVKPYDASSGKTYLDWLLEHAADAQALEAQDFGGAPRPGSLLYMLLHFSLVMESGRGLYRWLAVRGVKADELVRSRKFLNVGARPSPSVWEVFRAPANRLVVGEKSDRPLLEVLHSLQFATDIGGGVAEQRAALEVLRGMSTARLERALVEHVDTLSYRLDAWQTSLFSRRLYRQRRLDEKPDARRTGLYLGTYGYLEHVRASTHGRRPVAEEQLPPELRQGTANLFEQVGNGGYVHAPSLNHATAAALLRNGYLTHATPEQPDSLAVNLSSERVRRARYLLEGVRNGQSLEVLLGVQFERGLHDWTTRPGQPVILDQLKPVFRAAFPIRRTRVPQSADAGGGAATITEDHQVVNGLKLAGAGAFPWGITELSALSPQQQDALKQEKDGVANTLDALRDVLTAESAYQLALGNFERASAVVQSIGDGTLPPDVEVLRTPRGTGMSFTNRLVVQLAPGVASNPWPAVPALTQRALLEPALNHWLGMLIPAPEQVRCGVRALAAEDGHELAAGVVSLADLGVQPIDFVYMVRSQPQQSSVAELEARIRHVFARANGVPEDAVVRITFGDAGGGTGRSFAEVLPLADRLRRLLGSARPLDARHFQGTSSGTSAAPAANGGIDVAELRARVGARLDAMRRLFRNAELAPPTPPLERALAEARAPGAPPATIEALRDALQRVADAGFIYAFPISAVGTGAGLRDALASQADSVLMRFDALSAETDAGLAEVDGGSQPADRKRELLADVVKGWVGGDFTLIPRFTWSDATAVANAHAAREALLDHVRAAGVRRPVDEWLHGAACVRPRVHGFELVRMMAEAVLADALVLSPLQLPFRAGDSWLGVEFPETMEVVHDTVAIVQHLPQGFNPVGPQSGLLIDEWVETVPNRREVTGLTFNFNAPNSAPPQALLLAVTPRETGHWKWDDLVETVRDTFRRARLRAVEPDQVGEMAGIGTLLPAVIAEFSTGRGSVSLDYSFMHARIREQAQAQMLQTAVQTEREG